MDSKDARFKREALARYVATMGRQALAERVRLEYTDDQVADAFLMATIFPDQYREWARILSELSTEYGY
jgi:hypothetical protein